MTFKIGYQILNIDDPKDIIKINFYWEAGLNNQNDYWIDIQFTNGYKWAFFLGSVKETAENLHDRIIEEIFPTIQILAK